jgi:TolB protein
MKLIKQLGKNFLWVLGFFLLIGPIHAEELRIDVTQGRMEPMPIAITEFQGDDSASEEMGRKVTEVVAADLERSGLFKLIDKSAFIQTSFGEGEQIRFADWRLINAQALLRGKITRTNDGKVRVEFRLYDVYAGNQMAGLAFTSSVESWRRLAHKVADAVYERVTGEKGYFDTKIIYVSRVEMGRKRIERLAMMDQDGENHRYLTDGRTLVLTPRFSPKMDMVAYLNFANRKPHVYLMKLPTLQMQSIGHFPGMTYAPHFSPDGTKLLMGIAQEGVSSIYLLDLINKKVQRLTNEPQVIDTSPCFSPDGSQIVFNSDRGGSPQLYVMGASDLSPKRISFGEGTYLTPVWSPRGDWIAFTKILPGRAIFAIGVMKADGSGERVLAQGYMVESPTWSPNGRVLMFTKQERKGPMKLHTIDLTGYNEREIPTPSHALAASWSPLIQ